MKGEPSRRRKPRAVELPPVPPLSAMPVKQAMPAVAAAGEAAADPVDLFAAATVEPDPPASKPAGFDLDDLLGDLGAAEPPAAAPPAEAPPADALPSAPEVDPLEDILAELPAAAPVEVDPLDDILAELSPAAPVEVDPLEDILAELPAAAPVEVDPLEDILAELPPAAPVETDPLDDILAELSPAAPVETDPLEDILAELPTAAPVETDLLDDILAELPSAAPVEADPLDDILGELPGPGVPPAQTPAAVDPLQDILGDLPAPAAESVATDDDDLLGDILGELPQAPVAQPAVESLGAAGAGDDGAALAADPARGEAPGPASLDMDDLLGEIVAPPDDAVGDGEGGSGGAAPSQAGEGDTAPARKRRLPSVALSPAVRRSGAVGLCLAATHALAFWLGTLSHLAANPEGPVAGESERAAVEEAEPEGIERYAGKEIDARVDGKTLFEDEEFRTAVDELVGGQEAGEAIAELAPKIHATQPIVRKDGKLAVRGCNPRSCGLENLTVSFALASKTVQICATRGVGDPPDATSTLYDEEGAREVESCEGYPHPPPRRSAARAPVDAEPDDPADITFKAGGEDKRSISERIQEELAKLRDAKRRKHPYE
ncbi:hypothetical protein [Novosphingobium huizhouense]|uniref:hypothetical protein n=1 Tax=Novosphingobium huizhouense TaxID=2866625 RepID=UPI001CD8E0B7|nr:hypothetical protein [Novosphingobium huizhouense]